MVSEYKILVAEDNAIIRQALILQLKQLGHQPEQAVDGMQAYKKYCESPYALILMDVNMPICSGTESTVLIREYEQKNHLLRAAIVAVTALPETRPECYSSGMDDFIMKPLLFERLKSLVDRWMPICEPS